MSDQAKIRRALVALGRPLSAKEEAVVKWLLNWDRETVETIDGLFAAMHKAGQEEASSTMFLHLLDAHNIGYNIDPGNGALWINEGEEGKAIELADKYDMRELLFGRI